MSTPGPVKYIYSKMITYMEAHTRDTGTQIAYTEIEASIRRDVRERRPGPALHRQPFMAGDSISNLS